MNDEHVPGDELAELDEGLLPAIRAAQVDEHLADCAPCRERRAQIGEVRHRLAALPPVSMPGGVSDRISASLRGDSRTPPRDTGVHDSTVVPLQPPSRHRRRPPALAGVAATIVVLAAIAAVVVGHFRHHSGASHHQVTAGSAAAHRPLVEAAPHQFTVHTTGRNYTPSSLPAAVPALVTGGLAGATETATPGPSSSQYAARSGTSGASGSGGEGHGVAPDKQTRQPALAPAQAAGTVSGPVPGPLRHLYQSRSALLDCAATVSDTPGAVPLTVDFARWTNNNYHAAPSVIFVFRQSPTTALTIVTGPTCAGLDAVRDYRIVPLP